MRRQRASQNSGSETESNIAAYIFDQTMLKMYMEQNENQRMVVGLIYIDNYEELLDNVDEVKQSMLLALTDQKINKFIQIFPAL